jgi:hypothetical protein
LLPVRGVERARLAGGRIEQIEAVAESFRHLERVGEEMTRVVEVELVHVADVAHDARRHVAHDEVRASR